MTPEQARSFALIAHGDQRYGEHRPYSYHLDQVVSHLQSFGETAMIIGYLHDVVEDTAITLPEIRAEFGDLVADCVNLLTDAPGSNRKERKAKTYAKLALVSGSTEMALIVKTADRLANVMACIADEKLSLLKVYQEEHPAFKRAAFRNGLCDSLWGALNSLLENPAAKNCLQSD